MVKKNPVFFSMIGEIPDSPLISPVLPYNKSSHQIINSTFHTCDGFFRQMFADVSR